LSGIGIHVDSILTVFTRNKIPKINYLGCKISSHCMEI